MARPVVKEQLEKRWGCSRSGRRDTESREIRTLREEPGPAVVNVVEDSPHTRDHARTQRRPENRLEPSHAQTHVPTVPSALSPRPRR